MQPDFLLKLALKIGEGSPKRNLSMNPKLGHKGITPAAILIFQGHLINISNKITEISELSL